MRYHTGLFIPGPTNIPDAVRRAHERADGGHARPGLPQVHAAAVRGPEEGVQDRDRAGVHLPRLRHRRLGSRADQHALARRPGAGGAHRPILPPVDRHVQADRPRRGRGRLRVGRGRPGRALRRDPGRRQGAQDQGGAGHPQRDRDRRHQRRAPACAPPWTPSDHPAHAVRRRRQLDRQHRLPHGRMGRRRRGQRLAEGLHAADRPRPSSPSARRRWPPARRAKLCSGATSTSPTWSRPTRTATSPTRRPPPCCAACAARSTCCSRKGWRTSSRATTAWPRRSARGWRPGA